MILLAQNDKLGFRGWVLGIMHYNKLSKFLKPKVLLRTMNDLTLTGF